MLQEIELKEAKSLIGFCHLKLFRSGTKMASRRSLSASRRLNKLSSNLSISSLCSTSSSRLSLPTTPKSLKTPFLKKDPRKAVQRVRQSTTPLPMKNPFLYSFWVLIIWTSSIKRLVSGSKMIGLCRRFKIYLSRELECYLRQISLIIENKAKIIIK